MTITDVVRTPGAPTRGPFSSDSVQSFASGVGDRPVPGRGALVHECLRATLAMLDELPELTNQFTDPALTDLVGTLAAIRARAEHTLTLATTDAIARGTISNSPSASATSWISDRAAQAGHPIEPREAHTMAVVADACRAPSNAVIREAVRDGTCTMPSARTSLVQADRVAPVLPASSRDEVLAWYLSLDPALGTKGQHQLTRRILAQYAPDELDRDDARLEDAETLTWSAVPGGMTRLVAHLAPSSAACLQDAITALSAPRTTAANETGPAQNVSDPAYPSFASSHTSDGLSASEPAERERVSDTRTPAKRRVDALLELITAGARLHTGTDSGWVGRPAATVTVTMPLQTLVDGVGAATTLSGDVLDATSARRLACDADLIPAVLGAPSEPLDVGRRQRLVTKGLRAAVTLRDRGCTFPGCDRPPQLCDVHHLESWWSGGVTSLGNSAMLCTTHHRTVHRHGYTAALLPHDTGPTMQWNLSPATP